MAVQFVGPRPKADAPELSPPSDSLGVLQQETGETVDNSDPGKEEEGIEAKQESAEAQTEAIGSGASPEAVLAMTSSTADGSQALESETTAATGWPAVVKGLIRAVVETQRPEGASSMLLAVFTPVVEGWASSRAEAQRWKTRADAQMSELHRHRSELGGRADALEAEIESLQRRLTASQLLLDARARESHDLMRESQAKDQTIQSQRTSFEQERHELRSRVDELRHALDEQRSAASELSAQNEELARKAHTASLALEKLRSDSVAKQLEQAQDITRLQSKVRENEETIASLRQSLNESILKNRSLQDDLTARNQEYTTLLNNRSATRVIPRRF